MAAQEDFSFPTTTDTPPRFIESPRLWRTASLASSPQRSTTRGGNEDDDFNFSFMGSKKNPSSAHKRKSFSHVECRTKRTTAGYEEEEEEDFTGEKMDMLWEDFNEEFPSRNSNLVSSRLDDSDRFCDNQHRVSHGKMLNFGCVHSLKLSKPNRKPSIVVFMKVLKKMLSLQNSHRTVRTQG